MKRFFTTFVCILYGAAILANNSFGTLHLQGFELMPGCENIKTGRNVWPISRPLVATSPGSFAKPMRKQSYQLPELVGFVIYQADWSSYYCPYGLYSLSPSRCQWMEASSELLCATGNFGAREASGQLIDDKYYLWSVEYDGMAGHAQLRTFDTATWSLLSSKSVNDSDIPHELAYNPNDGILYGCFVSNDGMPFLAKVNTANGTHEKIANLPFALEGMACNASGILYGFAADGALYKINTLDGTTEFVLSTYERCDYASSATCDWETGIIYWAPSSSDGCSVHAVIPQSKMTVQVAFLADDDEFVGLSINPYAAISDAPSAPSNLSASFNRADLTGSVSFTSAKTSVAGEALDGPLNYSLYVDRELVAVAECLPGDDVSVEVTLNGDGMHNFSVNNTNVAGKGPTAMVSKFVGLDTPYPPANVTASLSDDMVILSWDKVTQSVNGGYVDFDNIVYEVSLNSDAGDDVSVLATTDENFVTFQDGSGSELERRSYSVTAVCCLSDSRVSKSDSAVSNGVLSGQCAPPRTFDFAHADDIAFFSWINSMNDRNDWTFDENEEAMTIQLLDLMNQHDHWFISPPVALCGGCRYEISALMKSLWSADERVDFRVGRDGSIQAMDQSLGESVGLSDKYSLESREFVAPDSGVYYFGVHLYSRNEIETGHPFVKEFSIGGPIHWEAPGEVSGFQVVPYADGSLLAKISFRTPIWTVGGNPLADLTKIELSRNGKLIKTWDSPRLGEDLSVVDEVSVADKYEYSIRTFSDAGEGPEVRKTVFIGINRPSQISSLGLERDGQAVVLHWPAVETDVDGFPLNPGLVGYEVLRHTSQDDTFAKVADLTGVCTYSDNFAELDFNQMFATYAVWPYTEAGSADSFAKTRLIAVGKPYGLPFSETFPLDCRHEWGMEKEDVSTAQWGFTTSDLTGIDDSDGNGSMMLMVADQIYNSATLMSGLISISGEIPTLTFDYFSFFSSCRNSISVEVVCGNESTIMETIVCGGSQGWHQAKLNLDAFSGKEVQIGFVGQVADYPYILLDNLRIGERCSHDIKAESLTTLDVAMPDEQLDVRFRVSNNGSITAESFNARLMRDGMHVGQLNGSSLNPGETFEFVFTDVFNMSQRSSGVYTATVEWEEDMDATNNTLSITAPVLYKTALPTPSNLRGELEADSLNLFWERPEVDCLKPFSDSFEFYGCSEYPNFGDWTSIDRDGLRPGRMHSIQFDGVEDDPIGFFLVDRRNPALSYYYEDFEPFDGNRIMVSLFGTKSNSQTDLGKTDDWLISPLLSGDAQTVTIHARSFSEMRPESFEVLYSFDAGINPDTFNLAASFDQVPACWNEYAVALPKGAKRFAIRCVSDKKYMLFIDAVTYVAGFDPFPYVDSYRVYQNGYRIGSSTDNCFSTKRPSGEINSYCVTAVYDGMLESDTSNKCVIDASGLETVPSNRCKIEIVGNCLRLVSESSEPFIVTDVEGRIMAAGSTVGVFPLMLAPGIYMAKIGNVVKKCIIK